MAERSEKERDHREVSHPGIAVTPGDPAGVGPLLILKALEREPSLLEHLYFCGDPRIWERASFTLGFPFSRIAPRIRGSPLPLKLPDPGIPTVEGAKLAFSALEEACSLLKTSPLRGLFTGPISKEWMMRAGFPYPGHTEFLAERFEAPCVLMVMSAPHFHVGLHTIHIPLREVPSALDRDRLYQQILLFARFVQALEGKGKPIAVCGLNPHAGEGGILGDEEATIRSAIHRAQQEGIPVEGPIPGDTAFFLMRQRNYGGVIAVYHDQGLAPFKTLYFHEGVNVTLGLPIVRVSPDHGTAFERAKTLDARETSTLAALRLCLTLLEQPLCLS